METLAWACGLGGVVLGGAAVFVPGFPGAAVAFLGVVAFSALTDFAIVPREGVVLAGGLALVAAVAQLLGPALASRALAGTAGAATGALVGAALGLLVPVAGVGYGLAVLGAMIGGAVASREGVVAWLRGVSGAAGGCCLAAAVDALAVLGCAAILAIGDFVRTLSQTT